MFLNRGHIAFMLGTLAYIPTLLSNQLIFIPAINGPPSNFVNVWFDINEVYLIPSILGYMFLSFYAYNSMPASVPALAKSVLCSGTAIVTILGTPNITYLPGSNPGYPAYYAAIFLNISILGMICTACLYGATTSLNYLLIRRRQNT